MLLASAESSPGVRLATIDVIRGVALLGVLMVNIHLFAVPEVWHYYPIQRTALSNFDQAALLVTAVFMEGKFIALLSLLFGAGMTLFAERYGQAARWAHGKRMGMLGAIGMLHAYGFWYGDILVTYAISGLLAWWILPLKQSVQIRLIGLFFAVPVLHMLLAASAIPQWDNAASNELRLYIYPDLETLSADIAGYQEGFWAQWAVRAPAAWLLQFDVLLYWTLWYTLGLMLFGAVLQRNGWFVAPPFGPWSRLGLVIGALGLGISLTGALTRLTGQPDDLAWLFFYQPLVQQLGALLLAFWYLLVLLSWSARRGLVERLAAIGRWSLSVYLLQSLLCGALFYGHGLGWYGQRSPAEVLLLGVLLSLLLLWCVPIWERRFGIGPAERLWRRAVRKPPAGARTVI